MSRRNEHRAANYAQTREAATSSGLRWEQWEDRAITTRTVQWARGLTDRQLSTILGRSVQAIQVRRTRIERRST
jgi:hypothetical protein